MNDNVAYKKGKETPASKKGCVHTRKNKPCPIKSIKDYIDFISYSIKEIKKRDPAAKSEMEILLLYPGLHAIMAHRIAHALYKNKHYFMARAISEYAHRVTGIDIHPGATIGKGLFIDHGHGVVIGQTAVIGDNCTIYQGVTLGGTGKEKGKRHPTIGDNVLIGAGAKILGPVKIGSHSKIAAGAVVLRDIPENSTAVGIPARVVKQGDKRVCDDFDQVNIPDPIAQELSKLCDRLSSLEHKLSEMENRKKFWKK